MQLHATQLQRMQQNSAAVASSCAASKQYQYNRSNRQIYPRNDL